MNQQELLEDEKEYRKIIELLRDGVVMFGINKEIMYKNSAAEKILDDV